MPTQVSLLDGALASAGTLAIQTNGTTNAITISSAQVATFVNNPIMTGLTASRAVFTDGSKGLTSNAITGTGNVVMSASPTLTGTISGAAITLSSDLTLSGGTANGVLYLNGSKVATSGSALTFDGSYLNLSRGSSGTLLNLTDAVAQTFRVATTASTVNLDSASGGSLAFLIGSSEQMRLTSTGLGIGTSSPSAPLTVQGSAGGLGINIIGRSAGQNEAWLYWYKNGGSTLNAGILGDNQGLKFAVDSSATERMRLDSSGNLGLGVTPSAWASAWRTFQIGNRGSITGRTDANSVYLGTNVYYDGSSKYLTNGFASWYAQNDSAHYWYTAPSGTAGNAITFTQAMTLDASGNLGVGTTSPASKLEVQEGGTGSSYGVISATATGGGNAGYGFKTGGTIRWWIDTIGSAGSESLRFYSSSASAERMRIDSSGNFLVGATSGIASERLFVSGSNANYIERVYNSNASPYGIIMSYTGAAPNGTANEFLRCDDTGAARMSVRSNGGIANYQANNVNLSDRQEKTNFAPAGNYLAKICAIPVQTFNYIDQNLEEDAGLTLGVVAQDVQAVAPELVMESNWGTEENPKMRLSIYQTDLQYALMKALQELKAEFDAYKATHP